MYYNPMAGAGLAYQGDWDQLARAERLSLSRCLARALCLSLPQSVFGAYSSAINGYTVYTYVLKACCKHCLSHPLSLSQLDSSRATGISVSLSLSLYIYMACRKITDSKYQLQLRSHADEAEHRWNNVIAK